MNDVIKNIMVLVVLSLTFTVVYADFEVSNNTIIFHVDKLMHYTANVSEESNTINQGEDLSIHLGEHVVLRSTEEKVSFVPLQSSVADRIPKETLKVIGFEMPDIYRSVSILFLSTRYANKKVESICRVLILHKNLAKARLTEIKKMLEGQGVKYTQKSSHILVECVNNNEGFK